MGPFSGFKRFLQKISDSRPIYDPYYACEDFPTASKPPQHSFEYRLVNYWASIYSRINGEARRCYEPRESELSGVHVTLKDLRKHTLKRPLDNSDIFAFSVINTVGKDGRLGDSGTGWKWAGTIKKNEDDNIRKKPERAIFVRCQDCERKKRNEEERKRGEEKEKVEETKKGENKTDEDGFETIPLDDNSRCPLDPAPFQTAQGAQVYGELSDIGESYAVVGRSRGGNILVYPPPPQPGPVKMHL